MASNDMVDRQAVPGPTWMHPADEDIISHLQAKSPEYLPLVANRLGMHLGYVERRCAVLVDRGFVEPVSDEVVYRTTTRGERYLAGETSNPERVHGD